MMKTAEPYSNPFEVKMIEYDKQQKNWYFLFSQLKFPNVDLLLHRKRQTAK